MKTGLLLIVFSAISTGSFAQGNGNNQNYIHQNGNVGIGNTSPSHRLQVSGNMKVDSSLVVQDTLFVQSDARLASDLRVEGASKFVDVQIDGTLYMTNLQPNENPETYEIMVAKDDGTVMKTSLGTLFGWEPPKDTDPSFCEENSAYRLTPYWSAGIDKLITLCSDVHVGIAKADPRVPLDVSGTTFTTRLFLGTADPLNPPNGLDFHLRAGYVDNNLDRELFLISNMNRKLFSVNNNGLIRSREIRIDATTWADHVFQPSYTLLPLSEVATYIAENGHLPDVPSEAQVKADGINVAEMDALLLQKIEELTLYTIQLEERLKAMEQKNDN